jgi:pimeloyl-ACP methyl ester carboxylesterase
LPELKLRRGDQNLFVNVSGGGPPLVFAHGLFGTHADASWVESTVPGFTLVAPDLRGRGKSRPSTSVERHSFAEHADDILTMLDHLEFHRAVICGSSFGAAVAVAFALRHIERVGTLILIASAFGALEDEMGEGNLDSYGELGERVASEGLKSVAEREAARTGSDRPLTRWLKHDEASLIAFLRAVPVHRPFREVNELHAVTVPTLVIPGRDAIHTPELSAAYADALPDARLVEGKTTEEVLGSFLNHYRSRG